MIPNKSEASLKNGNWFIHNDGVNIIQVWGSNLNGKEKVYINSELVSEQRSIKMQSGHQFTDKNGNNYEVIFETESLLKGRLKCVLKNNDTILRTFKTEYLKGKNFTLKRFLPIILVSALFGVLKSIYNLSDLTFILFLIMVLVVHFVTRNKGEIIIKEE
jgi:hypothetical protein